MPHFKQLKKAIQKQIGTMLSTGLFKTSIDKDTLWETYLSSFPEGTNPLFREKTEHDCNCCKSFIRQFGNVVTIIDNKLVSIWDITISDEAGYATVSAALSAYVKSQPIRNVYLSPESHIGTDTNLDTHSPSITWNHFSTILPSEYVMTGDNIGPTLSAKRSTKEVFQRGLDELTLDSLETVLELIAQDSLYRGKEHENHVSLFKKLWLEYQSADNDDLFCWANFTRQGSRIRNSAIGTLLIDLSADMELDQAVRKFEAVMAPANYKRPKALITKAMISNAEAKVLELNIADALPRRHSTIDDITINNILFADRTAKAAITGSIFDTLKDEVAIDKKKLGKVEEVSIDTFISEILPQAESIEILLENRHTNNLMSLVSPVNPSANSILKWNNNFSWSYHGEVADSMKARVAKAGGKVDGVLRFSLQWNEEGDNSIDFDAHCIEPKGFEIYYGSKVSPVTGGNLDVDIITPGRNIAVENITWPNRKTMNNGTYKFVVNNYSSRTSKGGFTAEIEYEGTIHSFAYNQDLRSQENVTVAIAEITKEGLTFTDSLKCSTATKEVWSTQTESFQKVSVIMNSPNHWQDKPTGNKHYFFMIDGCKNPDDVRTMYNEFLSNDLTEHRKVMEVLAGKMKAPYSDSQLSGLGFSSTVRNSVLCKVSGSFNRTIKINF